MWFRVYWRTKSADIVVVKAVFMIFRQISLYKSIPIDPKCHYQRSMWNPELSELYYRPERSYGKYNFGFGVEEVSRRSAGRKELLNEKTEITRRSRWKRDERVSELYTELQKQYAYVRDIILMLRIITC